MLPPLLLSIFATLPAVVVAYGTHPAWVQYRNGLGVILISRRLQWPLVTLSLLLSVGLIAYAISGRRRAWWLIALGPVLALFVHRFISDPTNQMSVVEGPTFVTPDKVESIADEDYVVGITFEGKQYAYPYASLYSTPVVVQSDHDKRMILMWSAYANRAVAVGIKREVRGRDLDIVSIPANALLLYNARIGEFVNGLTGRTISGGSPAGFLAPIPTTKTTWGQWRRSNPTTTVMALAGGRVAEGPRQPLLPTCPMPAPSTSEPAELRVAMVGAVQPLVMRCEMLSGTPFNGRADGVPVMAFRDSQSNAIRAFDRRIDDLSPRFETKKDVKRPRVAFVDVDTNTGWDFNGWAVDAKKPYKGKRLARMPAEDGLYWGVMKFWYPQLELSEPQITSTANAQKPVARKRPRGTVVSTSGS